MSMNEILSQFIIKGRIPSKKNSKRVVRWFSKKTWKSRPIFLSNDDYLKWEESTINFLRSEMLSKIKEKWLKIRYEFTFWDKRKTDLSNKVESVQDMLVKWWFLEDDSYEYIQQYEVICNWYEKDIFLCVISIYKIVK